MESPLVVVFLTVIALTALIQAGFVGALAFGLRAGNQKLADLEARFEQRIVPQIRSAARLTARAAELSEQTLAQARRVDTVVGEASRNAERYLDEASMKLEGAVERAAVRVDSEISLRTARVREHTLLRKLSSATAFVTGLQRALEVWQASASPNGADEDDEDALYADEEDDLDSDSGPADPSPA